MKFILIFIFSIFLYTAYPTAVHGGLFSFFSKVVNDQASAQTLDTLQVLNSQNMVLLQAAVNTDPNLHKTDEYFLLAYDNALVPEVGPQGTGAEIKDEIPTEINLYTVREGDNLSTIAEMFDVSINTIIWANELGKNPVLHVGDQLVILPITGIKYTVKKGDTIRGIVLRYKGDLEEVLQYNNLTLSSVLAIGDIIVIPDVEPTSVDTIRTSSSKGSNKPPLGYYIRPIEGGRKSQSVHGYNAVDLAAPMGTIIRASAAGRVISSISNDGWNGGYGNYVIIAHDNNTKTLYAHNQKNFVRIGDIVDQGDMIAKVGNTGKSTGSHVHFEIRGRFVNPF